MLYNNDCSETWVINSTNRTDKTGKYLSGFVEQDSEPSIARYSKVYLARMREKTLVQEE